MQRRVVRFLLRDVVERARTCDPIAHGRPMSKFEGRARTGRLAEFDRGRTHKTARDARQAVEERSSEQLDELRRGSWSATASEGRCDMHERSSNCE